MLNMLPKAHTMRTPPPTPTLTTSMFQIYHILAFRHRESVSTMYRHNHFTRRVWLKVHNFLIPEHPCWIGLHMEFQLTKWNLNSSPIPPHNFFIKIFSITFATLAGKEKAKWNKWEGLSILLIRVNLPPWISKRLFHPGSLFFILFKTPSQIACAFKWALIGSPKYFIGRYDTSQPRMSVGTYVWKLAH